MKLEGSLETFPLRELLEMTIYSSVTGVLSVFGTLDCGQIYFRNGQIYKASYSILTGLNAIAILFTEPSAHFSFTNDTVCEEENVWGDSLELTTQAEDLADRWHNLNFQLKHILDVPHQLSSLEKTYFHINPMHWDVFTNIDGTRNVNEIAQALGYELIDVCEAIIEMEQDKLIELYSNEACISKKETTWIQAPKINALKPKIDPPSTKPTQTPKVGLFDRLLATMPTPPSPSHPSPSPIQPHTETAHSTLSHAEEDILRLLRN